MANNQNLKPFKKGIDSRRNLLGRPVGALNFKTRFNQILALAAPEFLQHADEIRKFSQSVKTLTNQDVLDAVLLYKALIERDLASIKTILDRTEGPAERAVRVDTKLQVMTFADLARQAEAEMVEIQAKKTL
jgi:hypothetical protein